jgi:hypothetical protein
MPGNKITEHLRESLRSATPRIAFARYRFRFSAPAGIHLPAWTGSMWRGALGHALKRTVCVTRERRCQDCLLYRSCAYPYLFETPPAPESAKMRRYPAAPHPFVLEPERDEADGSRLLGLTLIGHGNRHLPYLVHALARAGAAGLGRERAPFALIEVLQDTGVVSGEWRRIHAAEGPLEAQPPAMPAIPPPTADARVRFITPLRVQRDSDLVTPENFRFADLFGPLLRRLSMLAYFHTDTPFETDFAGLNALARQVQLKSAQLHWREWTRYSSRQKTTMQMGGVVGTITLAATDIAPFWPCLWLGQWLHAGKATTMGLGRYTLEPQQACDPGKVAADDSCCTS